jgi:hypothetical protein
MWQEIVVLLIFLAAIAYLGNAVYQQFWAKSGCATGCGKCSAIDFKKIEAELKSKNS